MIKTFFRATVKGYQLIGGPWFGGHCRFWPSCSNYAIAAIDHHPWPRAVCFIVRRLARCHPWGGSGYDPV